MGGKRSTAFTFQKKAPEPPKPPVLEETLSLNVPIIQFSSKPFTPQELVDHITSSLLKKVTRLSEKDLPDVKMTLHFSNRYYGESVRLRARLIFPLSEVERKSLMDKYLKDMEVFKSKLSEYAENQNLAALEARLKAERVVQELQDALRE